jgi:D-3-phosphoglycerate dehydrogenase
VAPLSAGEKAVQELAPEAEENAALLPIGARVVRVQCDSEKALADAIQDADGLLLGGGTQLHRGILEELTNCKAIVRYGIGVDNIDVDAATDLGIVVANTPDFCVEEVANHAIMLLLACAKKLVMLHHACQAGNWEREQLVPMPTIHGQTLALIGYGKLARAVARKAQAFQMRVIAYDPYADMAEAWENGVNLFRCDLEQVLSQADYVSMHVPLTKETRQLIGEAELKAMKPSAYLINTSRGPVIQEAALVRALKEGWIAGAGLDVFETEPTPPDNPLLTMSNVVVTPHTASYSDQAFRDMRTRVGEEMARVLTGRWPLCAVNPQVHPKTRLG